MPGSEGQWDMIEIFRWRCDKLKSAGANAKTQETIDLELRELQAIVEKREQEARNARGEMLPKDAVYAGMMTVFLVIRKGLEDLQREFGSEAYAIIVQSIKEAEKQIVELFGTDSEVDAPNHRA